MILKYKSVSAIVIFFLVLLCLSGCSSSTGALRIVKFGPQDINAGEVFNPQSKENGQAALWLRLSDSISGKAFVFINNTELAAAHEDNLVTVVVPAVLYSKPGSYPMYVVILHNDHKIKSEQVDFVVH